MIRSVIRKIRKIEHKFLGKFFPVYLSKKIYFKSCKKRLDLNNPITFNEKLMYIKINNYFNNETVFNCVDKFLVRNYALEHGVPEKNLPKLIGVFNSPYDIDFTKLPNKFALKCTHGCGYNIICQNKSELNINKTVKTLNKWLNTTFGYEGAENHYTHVKPRIIVEEYIESNKGLPYDYKFYCYNGIPKGVLVCSERETQLKLNYYDLGWNELPYINEKYKGHKVIKKPVSFNKMIEISKKVSKEFPFVRVDFYQYKDDAIMGEMTFTPACCIADYYTEQGNIELAKDLKIK